MRRQSALTPIFDPGIRKGYIPVGHQIGIPSADALATPGTVTATITVIAPSIEALSVNPFPSMTATGAGTANVTLGYPTGTVDGDVVVLIAYRQNLAWGSFPSGFTEKADFTTPGLSNHVAVVTGVYDFATHGVNFTYAYTGGTSVTRAILYSVTGVTTAVNGFSGSELNGNDQFFPAITTPGGAVAAFAFAASTATFTDEQANGWTDDWGATTVSDAAWSKTITSSGAQTMPRWDNVANVDQVSFYMVP